MKMHYIDTGYFEISTSDATKLAGGTLPRHGYMRDVQHADKAWRLTRTRVFRPNGVCEQVWAIYELLRPVIRNGGVVFINIQERYP